MISCLTCLCFPILAQYEGKKLGNSQGVVIQHIRKKTHLCSNTAFVLDYIRDGLVVAHVGENLHLSAFREFLDSIRDGDIVQVACVGLHLHLSAVTCLPILTIVSNLGYTNRYEQSRLSRDCAIIILVDDSIEVQWTRTLFSLLSFRTFDQYLTTLDTLFVDKFAYFHA